MDPRARRILIPLIVALAALGVVLVTWLSPGRQPRNSSAPADQIAATQPETPPASDQQQPQDQDQGQDHKQADAQGASPDAPEDTPKDDAAPSAEPAASSDASLFVGLTAVAPPDREISPDASPQPLGSLDPRRAYMLVEFTRQGAGIESIRFSDLWQTALAKREAEQYLRSLSPEEPYDLAQVDESKRYILQTTQNYEWVDAQGQLRITPVPVLAAHSITINGQYVPLLLDSIWAETAPGRFETHIVNSDQKPIAVLVRQFSLSGANGSVDGAYDIILRQRVRNLTDQPLEVRWGQYGPTGLPDDKSGYIDRRRFSFGFLPDPDGRPGLVRANDNDLIYERSDLLKLHSRASDPENAARARELRTIWPNRTSTEHGYGLSWFAATNRYFALAVHPLLSEDGRGSRSLEDIVDEVRFDVSPREPSKAVDPTIFTYLTSPTVEVAPGAEIAFDMGVFAGPMDRHVLNHPPYSLLNMSGLILYEMSGCCTFLTFQWLAHFLLWFLSVLHMILFDWGLAIIGLVIVVRTLLHPLTKKSQISMQRFGKQMAALKPEIDKIQKRYGHDPKRAQAEQIRLMREHNLNPLQMLGCLPMFLQMPIWIALWAMLYFAFDLRQEPAFYGVFQLFGNWQFLADLSVPDRFISLGSGFRIPLIGIHVTSINLLPILMGVVFYIQQKYMSPPPTPNMTPEQIQQQKIMKVMMVVLFPLFLYAAPSGLTLYIFTSTCVGILESRYVRRHIDQMDLTAPAPAVKKREKKTIRDPRARAFAEAIERAKAKRREQPPRSFKKRK